MDAIAVSDKQGDTSLALGINDLGGNTKNKQADNFLPEQHLAATNVTPVRQR